MCLAVAAPAAPNQAAARKMVANGQAPEGTNDLEGAADAETAGAGWAGRR